MSLQIADPLQLPDWDEFVLATERASFFCSSAWARVLCESYGYKPVYFTSFEKGKLSSLMPFMEVNSWLTGKRGVSLPFTDQCTPIVADDTFLEKSIQAVIDYGEKARWKYAEWRHSEIFPEEKNPLAIYCGHELDLRRDEKELLSGLRDSTRRNLRKAAKFDLSVEISNCRESIESYYRLHCTTRKRHGVPPQPRSFFQNIFDHVISKDYGIVVSASHAGKAISSCIFFHFGRIAIYKFGASDRAYHKFRPNNLVMWEAIRWYRDKGFELLDLGRTEPENEGLLQYKRGWGAQERIIKYYRYNLKKAAFQRNHGSEGSLYRRIFTHTPVGALRILGSVLYKHIG